MAIRLPFNIRPPVVSTPHSRLESFGMVGPDRVFPFMSVTWTEAVRPLGPSRSVFFVICSTSFAQLDSSSTRVTCFADSPPPKISP